MIFICSSLGLLLLLSLVTDSIMLGCILFMFYFCRHLPVSVVRDKVWLEVFFFSSSNQDISFILTTIVWCYCFFVFFCCFSPHFNTMFMLFWFPIFQRYCFFRFSTRFFILFVSCLESILPFFLLLIHIYKIHFPYINI